MPVGTVNTGAIKRAGLRDVTIDIDRGAGAGVETESLMPASNGNFFEEQIKAVGLDGKIDVKGYRFTVVLDYLQTDATTLADLYDADLDSQFHTAGVSTVLTFLNGDTLTITMYFSREVKGEGYDSVMLVRMIGTAFSTTPHFR